MYRKLHSVLYTASYVMYSFPCVLLLQKNAPLGISGN